MQISGADAHISVHTQKKIISVERRQTKRTMASGGLLRRLPALSSVAFSGARASTQKTAALSTSAVFRSKNIRLGARQEGKDTAGNVTVHRTDEALPETIKIEGKEILTAVRMIQEKF